MAGLTGTGAITRFLDTVVTLVRMKFTILGHTSAGMRLSRRVFWPLAVAVTWAAVVFADGPDARRDVLLLSTAFWGAGWALGPVLASGAGVLRPAFFGLLPLERRRLGLALLAAACVGYGPAVTVLALASLGFHAADLAPAALPVALLALPPLLVFVVALSRAVYAVMGAAMGSRLGVTMSAIQYGALIAGMLVGWLALSRTGQGVASVVDEGLPGETAARALEAAPTSWPVLAVEAAAEGRWAAAIGLLLALKGAALAAAGLCALLLTPRTTRIQRRRRPPLGAGLPRRRPLLPATPLGAVTGRELRHWWRDPWRSLELQCGAWTGIFVAVIALASGHRELLPFAGLSVALMTALVACNLLGHDGTSVWLTVVAAGPDTLRADIRGRQLALLLLFAPASLLLTVAFTAPSGQTWAWPLLLALLPALLGSAVGVAVLLSVVAATPGVDPRYRVGPNDSGDVSYQVWIALYGTAVPALPTLAIAVPAATSGPAWLAWSAVPLGLANGTIAAWWLGRLAHHRLAARLPETFVRLRYGKAIATQHQPDGSDWLDRLERGSIAGNQERKPVGT